MDTKRAGLGAVLLAVALWGVGGTVAGDLFEHGVAPLELVSVRMWTAAAGLLLIVLLRRERLRVGSEWPAVVGFGLGVAVASAALFLSISRLPVAVALVLQNLAPAFILGWTAIVTRRRPSRRVVLGIALALGGVAFVVELPTAPLDRIDLLGVVYGLLTAVAVGVYSLLGERAVKACGAMTANTWAFGVSAVLWIVYQVPHGVPAIAVDRSHLTTAVLIGLFGTLIPFLLYSWGIRSVGATLGAVNMSLEPLFGAALAWAWLGQALTPAQIAGAAVVLIALVDVQVQAGRTWKSSASKVVLSERSPTAPGSRIGGPPSPLSETVNSTLPP
ncbi:EamA family transporter [Actinocorallia longicatena]|uniref:EamA family transporter n=1 Tax=Actinocorallia longicatena TaxID=111803 RepID=UPI0031E48F03